MPVIVIRPEPGCSATVAAGKALGLPIEAWPMFAIRPVAWQPASPDAFDGLLIGSANAVRHAGPQLARWAGKPVFAVGQASAEAAEQAGLAVAAVGRGGLQAVLDELAPRPSRLLRLAGAEHVELQVPPEIGLETRIVYDSVPLAMDRQLTGKLADGAIVLLHSAAAARHFAHQCDQGMVHRAAIMLVAMGPRIADAAGGGWKSVHVCAQVTDSAILAMAGTLCH